MEVNDIVIGKIKNVKSFGAFIEFEGGQEGLLKISEICNGYVSNIHDYVNVGDSIKVRIIKIDAENRLQLSTKEFVKPIKRTPQAHHEQQRPTKKPAQQKETDEAAKAISAKERELIDNYSKFRKDLLNWMDDIDSRHTKLFGTALKRAE